MPVSLLSTDFDGTLFAEFENPPVPFQLQELLRTAQARGVKWVINTGRDMSSLQEALGRAGVSVHPDYLVLVEREIYVRREHRYVSDEAWNDACSRDHAAAFAPLRPRLAELNAWINERFDATLYSDAYSPFCLIAQNNGDADQIVAWVENFVRDLPDLVLVRNDVYMRFSRVGYDKGTALAEISRQLGLAASEVFAAGDHLNDLPMLKPAYARHLAAPSNAVPQVKQAIQAAGGYLSPLHAGHGIADALERLLG
jgi:hydroxymethylpyrimidine pyrophosphatase-like HAD family hydrolase